MHLNVSVFKFFCDLNWLIFKKIFLLLTFLVFLASGLPCAQMFPSQSPPLSGEYIITFIDPIYTEYIHIPFVFLIVEICKSVISYSHVWRLCLSVLSQQCPAVRCVCARRHWTVHVQVSSQLHLYIFLTRSETP